MLIKARIHNIFILIPLLMMKRGAYMLKKCLSVAITMVMILGLSSGVFASTTSDVNTSESKIVEKAFLEIKEQIIQDYEKLYKLDHFTYDYKTREVNHTQFIDINIYADMTLTRHPQESPFVIGMKSALDELTNEVDKANVQREIDLYSKEIEELYLNIPNRSTFTYTISQDEVFHLAEQSSEPSYSIFYRTDASDETILVDHEQLAEVENPDVAFQHGQEAVKELLSQLQLTSSNTLQAVSYDRLAARDWARDNYAAKPEYPSKTVGGTDCANFVSKALNKGGIPQDKSGKWYQAATWGGWPGDHWFRTGYNGKTGVVIYMSNKGYFAKESKLSKVIAGSIMYWNKTSHVALVTYSDGSTIKYTQHGASQTKDTVYKTENASFYRPTSSILK